VLYLRAKQFDSLIAGVLLPVGRPIRHHVKSLAHAIEVAQVFLQLRHRKSLKVFGVLEVLLPLFVVQPAHGHAGFAIESTGLSRLPASGQLRLRHFTQTFQPQLEVEQRVRLNHNRVGYSHAVLSRQHDVESVKARIPSLRYV